MKKKNKSNASDFRYSVGDARVPWHTVGERFNTSDVFEVVRFLMPEGRKRDRRYAAGLKKVRAAIEGLGRHSPKAAKLTLGSQVQKAEARARELLKVRHACMLSNWTAGMEIAYKLSGLRAGDEVIIPSITFIASAAYPLSIGARVVFADIDPATINMDPEDVARKITPRTRVIMPVHIGGYPCDMDPIMRLARKRGIYVIEDAAHGLGAMYKGKHLGTIGHFGGFSLHEVKNINSFGEGGLLVTNLPAGEQFSRARFLGLNFSRTIKNWLYDVTALDDRFGRPQIPGNHSAMDMQGLGFNLQVERLDAIIARRRANAEYLRSVFAGERGIMLPPADTARTFGSHHLFLLRIDPDEVGADVQALKRKLKEKGITEIAHFGPLYKFDIFRRMGYSQKAIAASCPRTEELFNRAFTHMPLYPLTRDQVAYMAKAVVNAVRELKG